MAQSAGMAATFECRDGWRGVASCARPAPARRSALWRCCRFLTLAPSAAAASGNDGDDRVMSDEDVREAMRDATVRAQRHPEAAARRAAAARRGRRRIRRPAGAPVSAGGRLGSMLSGRSGLLGTALHGRRVLLPFHARPRRGRRKRRLGVVLPVLDRRAGAARGGVVASGVPDRDRHRAGGAPLAARSVPVPQAPGARSFVADRHRHQPPNATARRDLAKIWLEKHRPRRALPLLEQAIARDSKSVELLYLSGVAHLLAGNHDQAVEALVAVTHREPNFQYGEA